MTDRFTVRTVTVFLGLVALAALASGVYLSTVGRAVPDFVIASGSSSLGSLAALLARTGSAAER